METKSMKKLKIFMTAWHVMHYKDFAKAMEKDADIYLCTNMWRDWRSKTFLNVRDIPKNISFVSHYEEGKYDLAIFSIDQQCINKQDVKGKSTVIKEFVDQVKDIPVIVINHGSPVYPEYTQQQGMTFEDSEQACRDGVKEIIGDRPMVTNSYTAASPQEWGWGFPIRHGIDPEEWHDLPKEPRVFTALSPGGCDKYYNRECTIEVGRILKEHGYELWWAKCNIIKDGNFEEYREFLGRSLVYLDTSFRTPLNRARTEAMLSGCCVVQVEGEAGRKAHDLDYFAKNGENMLIVPNSPKDIAKLILQLIEDKYDETVKIGKTAKKIATEKFSYKIYRERWLELINKTLKDGRKNNNG